MWMAIIQTLYLIAFCQFVNTHLQIRTAPHQSLKINSTVRWPGCLPQDFDTSQVVMASNRHKVGHYPFKLSIELIDNSSDCFIQVCFNHACRSNLCFVHSMLYGDLTTQQLRNV